MFVRKKTLVICSGAQNKITFFYFGTDGWYWYGHWLLMGTGQNIYWVRFPPQPLVRTCDDLEEVYQEEILISVYCNTLTVFSTARICPMLELVCYSGREGLHQTASQKLAKKRTTRTSLFLKQVDEYKTNLVIHVRWMGVSAHTLHGKKTHIFQTCSMYVSCEFFSLA